MSILCCVCLFYVCSVCLTVIWGFVSMLMLGLSGCITSTSSLHLTHINSSNFDFTQLRFRTHHSLTELNFNSQHQVSFITQLWSAIKNNNISVTSLSNSCANWDNLRRQSQPHFHPFSSSASPYFNLQAWVFVFHTTDLSWKK